MAQAPEPQPIFASDAIDKQRLGYSVEVDGDMAAVGAYQDGAFVAIETGPAYLYRFRDGSWKQERKLESATVR